MTRNIKLVLQYDGTNYNGWQKQGNSEKTVQAAIELMLSRLLGQKTVLIGSGRTDAGAHAYFQVANFVTKSDMPAHDIMQLGNSYLPQDIVIKEISEADIRFHSRYNAVSKTYLYKIWTGNTRNVFEKKYYYDISSNNNNNTKKPDVKKMRVAASIITGKHNFICFSSLKKTKKSTIRTVYNIDIKEKDNEIKIYVRADGFLYNMVRIIIGTLLDVGFGKTDPQSIAAMFESESRELAGITVPPNALFLCNVEYDSETEINNKRQ